MWRLRPRTIQRFPSGGEPVIWACLWLAAAFSAPAYAYIDAGSGMLLLQIIGAAIAGGLFVFRKAIADLFHRVLGRPAPEDEPTDESGASDGSGS